MTLSEDLAIHARTISDDIEHGASHILKMASGSLYTALKRNPSADQKEIIGSCREFALRLISAHRRMAPILNFSNMLFLFLEDSKEDLELNEKLRELARKISRESSEAVDTAAAKAEKYISGNQFLTHSRSSTILHFLTKVRERDDFQVYSTQSRPGAEGRLLAGELAVAGIKTIIIEDSEVMRYLDRVSALLVGTDAIIPSGLVNKVGTHLAALAAREMGIPIYCLTESIKIWPFDQPVLEGLSKGSLSPLGGFEFFELVPGSIFNRLFLESGQTTFEQVVLRSENFRIASELKKYAISE